MKNIKEQALTTGIKPSLMLSRGDVCVILYSPAVVRGDNMVLFHDMTVKKGHVEIPLSLPVRIVNPPMQYDDPKDSIKLALIEFAEHVAGVASRV